MIVKIISHKRPGSFRKLLEYITNEEALDHNSSIITHNVFGKSVLNWEKQYRENETYRTFQRKNAVLLYHEIISFHKGDSMNISPKKLDDIAQEYINFRNPNALYVAAMHTNKEHYHLHFAVSALEYHNGKTTRLSKKELLQLKQRIQQHQKDKYPELSHSLVRHGEGKELPSPTANGS